MPPGAKPTPPGATSSTTARRVVWAHAGGVGWRHGDLPEPPGGVSEEAVEAWRAWMGAWWAWFWEPGDLPLLRAALRAWDEVVAGRQPLAATVAVFDKLGLTPAGRQNLRWAPPEDSDEVGDEFGVSADELKARRERRKRLA